MITITIITITIIIGLVVQLAGAAPLGGDLQVAAAKRLKCIGTGTGTTGSTGGDAILMTPYVFPPAFLLACMHTHPRMHAFTPAFILAFVPAHTRCPYTNSEAGLGHDGDVSVRLYHTGLHGHRPQLREH